MNSLKTTLLRRIVAILIFLYLMVVTVKHGSTGELWDVPHEVTTFPILLAGYLAGFFLYHKALEQLMPSMRLNPVSLEITDQIQENCIENLSWEILSYLDGLLVHSLNDAISSIEEIYSKSEKQEDREAGAALLAALHSFAIIGISRIAELKHNRETKDGNPETTETN